MLPTSFTPEHARLVNALARTYATEEIQRFVQMWYEEHYAAHLSVSLEHKAVARHYVRTWAKHNQVDATLIERLCSAKPAFGDEVRFSVGPMFLVPRGGPERQFDYFVSHGSADMMLATRFYEVLRKGTRGDGKPWRVFLATATLEKGVRWDETILERLRASRVVVVLWSPTAATYRDVEVAEAIKAHERGDIDRLVPIRVVGRPDDFAAAMQSMKGELRLFNGFPMAPATVADAARALHTMYTDLDACGVSLPGALGTRRGTP